MYEGMDYKGVVITIINKKQTNFSSSLKLFVIRSVFLNFKLQLSLQYLNVSYDMVVRRYGKITHEI